MALPENRRLRRSFRRARAGYDQEAQVQAAVAERLMALLAEAKADFAPRQALEAGCGTGLLTGKLLLRFGATLATLFANDLLEEHEDDLRRRPNPHGVALPFLAGDMETVDLPAALDLVASSSTLHWARNLPRLTARLTACLKPGGILALALYGPGNLRELRALTGTGLSYPSLAELRQMLLPHGHLLCCHEETLALHFDDPVAVLRHLRATGANALTRQGWTRGELARFVRGYRERFGGEAGVALTYHPLYIILEAKQTGEQPP